MKNEKCVIIVDENLPVGLIANTAAILGITLGARLPETVGGDVRDGSGHVHIGIIEFPVPVLKASSDTISRLRLSLYGSEHSELTVVDFSDIAQSCKTYDEYIDKISAAEDIHYFGIAVCGEKKKVSKLTGNFLLL
ncbi:MAG: DUF2000 domain-containing protein [Oscillospiraceae bacterium]|nr:DUF2000 domain-containing protein [Oscillospiraceae bacterium]